MRTPTAIAVASAVTTTVAAAFVAVAAFAVLSKNQLPLHLWGIALLFGLIAATGFWFVPVGLNSRRHLSAAARVTVIIFQIALVCVFGAVTLTLHPILSSLALAGFAASIYCLFVTFKAEHEAT